MTGPVRGRVEETAVGPAARQPVAWRAVHPLRSLPTARRLGVVVATGALVLVLVACGSSPSKRSFADALVTSGIPRAEATCTADALYKTLTKSQVQQVIDRGLGGIPKDDPDDATDAATKLSNAVATCRNDAANAASASEQATTTTAATASTTTPASTTSGAAFTTTSGRSSTSGGPSSTGG